MMDLGRTFTPRQPRRLLRQVPQLTMYPILT